ncbi:MAG: MATE family efflux transporter [Cellulosilyticum sp.]|nr:MATE family efflux transporter [Cellulosilyticum sp.]
MQTSNLTNESVSKLFNRYLVPSICGTLVTSIYVLADSIIIGKGIGTEALAALNIILPLFNIFFGNGLLFGVGGSVLMSIERGAGNHENGERYYSVALLLNAIMCVIYTALMLAFMTPMVTFLGATDVTMPYIKEYAPYVIMGMSCFSFSSFLQTFIRNDGAPKLAMVAVVTGGVLNIILDIIFVYPMQMGMKGAAIASVIGAISTIVILLTHFVSKKNGLHINLKGFSFKYVVNIIKNGFTSFFVEIASGVVMFIFNIQILKYIGDIGIGLYSVITNTVLMIGCLCNGINQAAQPIISVNYGAQLVERVSEVRRKGIKTAVWICSVIGLVALVMPDLLTYIFIHPTEEILALSKVAIRTYFIGVFVMGVNMFIISYFQSTLKPMYSIILCIARGCGLSVLFVYVLPLVLGDIGIWLAVPLAEITSLALGMFYLKKEKQQ